MVWEAADLKETEVMAASEPAAEEPEEEKLEPRMQASHRVAARKVSEDR